MVIGMTLGKSHKLTLGKSREWENPAFIAVFRYYSLSRRHSPCPPSFCPAPSIRRKKFGVSRQPPNFMKVLAAE